MGNSEKVKEIFLMKAEFRAGVLPVPCKKGQREKLEEEPFASGLCLLSLLLN